MFHQAMEHIIAELGAICVLFVTEFNLGVLRPGVLAAAGDTAKRHENDPVCAILESWYAHDRPVGSAVTSGITGNRYTI
jgi:hypothetical protein